MNFPFLTLITFIPLVGAIIIALIPRDGTDRTALLRNADAAMCPLAANGESFSAARANPALPPS